MELHLLVLVGAFLVNLLFGALDGYDAIARILSFLACFRTWPPFYYYAGFDCVAALLLLLLFCRICTLGLVI